jgi:hypothetical protein
MTPISIAVIVSLLVVGLGSGFVSQRTLDKWTQETGRAPHINKGRGSWSRYVRSMEAELPPSVRQRIRICDWVGALSIILMMIVLTLSTWRRN